MTRSGRDRHLVILIFALFAFSGNSTDLIESIHDFSYVLILLDSISSYRVSRVYLYAVCGQKTMSRAQHAQKTNKTNCNLFKLSTEI